MVSGIWASWGGKRTDNVRPVRIMCMRTTCKCTPGLTAWRVIYRHLACQLRDQMCSPDDDLSVRSGPAFGIAKCGKLRAKEDHVQCRVSGSWKRSCARDHLVDARECSDVIYVQNCLLDSRITIFTAARANETRIFISKGEAPAAKNTKNEGKKSREPRVSPTTHPLSWNRNV